MNPDQFEAQLHNALTAVGAVVIAAGYQNQSLVTAIIGALPLVIGLLLSLKANTVQAVAISAAVNAAAPAHPSVAQDIPLTIPAVEPPAPPAPAGTKPGFANSRLIASVGLLAIAVTLIGSLFTACNTTQLAKVNAAAAEVTPDQVTMAASVVNVATEDGVQLLLKKHPNYSADVILADKALNAFVAAGNIDPLALRTAIDAAIPAADQAEAQPVVDGVVAMYSSYVTPWLATLDPGTAKTYALQLLGAVDGGLNAALAPQ